MKRFFLISILAAAWISTVATTNVVKLKETYWIYEISSADGVWQDTTGVLKVYVHTGGVLWLTLEGDSETDSLVVLPSVAPPSKKEPRPKDWAQPASFVLRSGSAIALKPPSTWGWVRLIFIKSGPEVKIVRMGFRDAKGRS